MKFMALILLLSLTLQALAEDSPSRAFDQLLDSYEYAMTIEWDQRDPIFFEQQTNKTIEAISKLQNDGLKTDEMITVIQRKAGNRVGPQDFERLALEIPINSSAETIIEFWRQDHQLYSSRGASWVGADMAWNIGIWVTLSAFVAYAIYDIATHPCGAIVYNETRHRNVCTGIKSN